MNAAPFELLAILGLQNSGNHLPCRFCRSGDAMSVFKGDKGWRYKCHSCGRYGDTAQALATIENISYRDALSRLSATTIHDLKFNVRSRTDNEKIEKAPNQELLELKTRLTCGRLNCAEDVQEYLWRERAISMTVATRFELGVMSVHRVNDLIVQLTYTLPIRAHTEMFPIIGIKHHTSPTPMTGYKCYWFPKGMTQNSIGMPRASLLFPLPEQQNLAPGDLIVLAPGELKALAHIECGIAATSRTTGESGKWPDGLAQRFQGLCVVIDPDREDSEVSRTFVINATIALKPYAKSIEVAS